MADADVKPKRAYSRIQFPKDSPEYEAERKRRDREYYLKSREKKKAARKARAAELQGDAEKLPGAAPPMPKKRMPIEWSVPDDLREVFGEQVRLTAEWTGWPLFHVRRQETLSKTTMAQYKAYYHRLPRKDIWDQMRYVLAQNSATQNMFAKSGLSYVCQSLYDSIYVAKAKLAGEKDYNDRLLRMCVFSILNKKTKHESYERHVSQEASEARVEATVPWPEWQNLGRRYILAQMAKPTLTDKEKRDTLLLWAYSQMPPVRLDWGDIKVVRTTGIKGTEKAAAAHKAGDGNVLYLSKTLAIICWSQFKNAASFSELPLREKIDSVRTVKMLQRFLPAGDSQPFKVPNFSTYLTKLAQDLTGKPFTNRMMRSSYIRWWHDHHDTTNVKEVKAMMQKIHQTNMEVHLGYIKHKTTNAELSD